MERNQSAIKHAIAYGKRNGLHNVDEYLKRLIREGASFDYGVVSVAAEKALREHFYPKTL